MSPADYGGNRVSQHFHRPSLSVSNTLNTLRNFGKHTLDLHFSVGYAQRPNTLTVDVDSLQQGTSAYYNQDLTSRNIAANAHTDYPFHPGAFSLHYGVVAKASLHGIKTGLDGIAPPTEGASPGRMTFGTIPTKWPCPVTSGTTGAGASTPPIIRMWATRAVFTVATS